MARGRRSRPGAIATPIARRSLPQTYPGPFPHLSTIQDNRTWHPEGRFRAPLTLPGSMRMRIIAPQKQRFGKRPKLHQLAFAAPTRVLICVRRKRRKEVLHAKGFAGKRGLKKPKRNYWSSISCKR